MEPISERAREALEDHRRRTGFGPGRKDAVLARLEASIAAGAAPDFVAELDQAAAVEGTGASPNAAAGRRARIGGMLALVLAAGLAGVWWVSGQQGHEQAAPVPAQAAYAEDASASSEVADAREREARRDAAQPAVLPVAPVPMPEATADEAELPRAKRPRPRRAPAAKPTATTESTLAAEIALLREARAALADGELERALAALDRHARRFAGGQLEPERAALRVEVLCEIDPQRGERARRRFLDRFGTSGHAKRVRALTCKSPR